MTFLEGSVAFGTMLIIAVPVALLVAVLTVRNKLPPDDPNKAEREMFKRAGATDSEVKELQDYMKR